MFVTPVPASSASSAATGIMSGSRPLRGGCQCGRNRYIIAIPEDRVNEAQVLFNTEPQHQIPLATPLAAYIRVPLSWYHSTTYAFFPDETHSMIRRVYTHPSQDYSKRHFCGFCGTPLSYWSEDPRSEAEFINLTLGSLLREDIRDLEDIGLIPQNGDEDAPAGGEAAPAATPTKRTAIQQSFGVPWFDGLIEGSRLGSMRRSYGTRKSRDGQTSIEWDIVEFSENGGGETGEGDAALTHLGKRKLREHEA